jgi:hypothetical protein
MSDRFSATAVSSGVLDASGTDFIPTKTSGPINMNVHSLPVSTLAEVELGTADPATSAAVPPVVGPRARYRPLRLMRQRWAGAMLGLAMVAPALAIGPSYTTEYIASGCLPSGQVASPDLSFVCGPNFVQGTGSFDGGHASAELSAGLYRSSSNEGTVFHTKIDAQYNWNDQLSIVSATLPVGTPVLLNLGTQVTLRYDVSARDPSHGDDGVFAQAHLKISTPSQFHNDFARTRFRSTSGWLYAQETSGNTGQYGSDGTTGITRQSIVVQVGDVVNLDLIFRAISELNGAYYWEVDTPYESNLDAVDAFFAVSVTPLGLAVSAMPDGSFSAQSTPLVDYIAASGVRFASTLPVPVPEPATWALMLAGVAAVGRIAQRRRSTPG